MKAALTALGFPGEAALDSVAYQVMGALGEALGSFSALAPAAAQAGRAGRRAPVGKRGQDGHLPAAARPSARLDVLGLLEAEGGYGMGSGCWA